MPLTRAGRLSKVFDAVGGSACTGTLLEEYRYGSNNGRIYAMNSNGEVDELDVLLDDQDRLVEYGDLSFTYTANGELKTKTDAASVETWAFDYDVRGNLKQVILPGGSVVDYVTDGENRRVAKKVDGAVVQGFLYGLRGIPVAELDAVGNVVARFVYGGGRVPSYMVKDGYTYALLTDGIGSVIAVVNADTGDVVQQLEYDAFGRVLDDTNPGFQPFGFAGGLHDVDTGLVRFGARDYDPETGRWTSKDPILLSGGNTNLYAYANQDPVGLVDPGGLRPGDEFLFEIQAANDAAVYHITAGYAAKPVEWGTIIYKTGDDVISYVEPDTINSENSWQPTNKQTTEIRACGGEELAFLHHHPNGTNASPTDKATANQLNANFYTLRRPHQKWHLWVYIPGGPSDGFQVW